MLVKRVVYNKRVTTKYIFVSRQKDAEQNCINKTKSLENI
jgi:hypothetical protein